MQKANFGRNTGEDTDWLNHPWKINDNNNKIEKGIISKGSVPPSAHRGSRDVDDERLQDIPAVQYQVITFLHVF